MVLTESGRVSRTQTINAIVLTLGTAVGLFPQLQAVIHPDWYPWIFVGLSLLNVYLRQITSEPMR